jgi:hypothetical protein
MDYIAEKLGGHLLLAAVQELETAASLQLTP